MRRYWKAREWYRKMATLLCLCVLALSLGQGVTAYAYGDSDTMSLRYYCRTPDGSALSLYATEEVIYGSSHGLLFGKGLTRDFIVDGVKRTAVFAGWSESEINEPLLQNDKDLADNRTAPGKGLWEGIQKSPYEIPWNMTGIINLYAVYALDYNGNGVPDYEEEPVRIEYYANVGDAALDLEPFYTCSHHHTELEIVDLPDISGGVIQDPAVRDAMVSKGISRPGAVLVGWTNVERPKPVASETEFAERCIYKEKTPELWDGWYPMDAHVLHFGLTTQMGIMCRIMKNISQLQSQKQGIWRWR